MRSAQFKLGASGPNELCLLMEVDDQNACNKWGMVLLGLLIMTETVLALVKHQCVNPLRKKKQKNSTLEYFHEIKI